VLEDVGVNEAGHAHVKRAGAAAHDVDPELVEASFAWPEIIARTFSWKLPVSTWAGRHSSGSFDSPLLLLSRVLAQDWTGGSLSRVLFWVATTLAYAALQETV
jgi:hypothetical protein